MTLGHINNTDSRPLSPSSHQTAPDTDTIRARPRLARSFPRLAMVRGGFSFGRCIYPVPDLPLSWQARKTHRHASSYWPNRRRNQSENCAGQENETQPTQPTQPKAHPKQTCAEGQALAYRRCHRAIRSVIGMQIVADHARDGGLNRWKAFGRFWRYFKYLAYLVG